MRWKLYALASLLAVEVARGGIGLGEAFCGADALLVGVTNRARPTPEYLAMMIQATENLQRWVSGRNFASVHNEDHLLAVALTGLQTQKRLAGTLGLPEFADRIGALHMLADTENVGSVDAAMAEVVQSTRGLLDLFPKAEVSEALAIAERRSCHTHPEQIGQRGEKCFRCGSRLSQQVPVVPPSAGAQRIVASLRTPRGQTHTLQLALMNHQPVVPGRLMRVHGEKIHLFLLDSTFTEYHHVHARAGRKPGEYEFEFAPERAANYRLWIEAHVAPFAFRQYAWVDLEVNGARQEPRPSSDLEYDLITPSEGLYANVPAKLKLRVSDSDGEPFRELEPLMEAFAHLVGFGENYRTILHTHPLMAAVTNAAARGGPELEFQVLPTEPGDIRFFAQVKVRGAVQIAPFRVRVRANEPGRNREFVTSAAGVE